MAFFNSLRPRLNRRPFADDIFKCIFLNENEWILPRISLKFVPKVRINNIPSLFQIMAWCRPGDKPLSKPMMVSLLTHICVTRPQWVNVDRRWNVIMTPFGVTLPEDDFTTLSWYILWPGRWALSRTSWITFCGRRGFAEFLEYRSYRAKLFHNRNTIIAVIKQNTYFSVVATFLLI